eukprot:6490787-Amphidinium_carterae.1
MQRKHKLITEWICVAQAPVDHRVNAVQCSTTWRTAQATKQASNATRNGMHKSNSSLSFNRISVPTMSHSKRLKTGLLKGSNSWFGEVILPSALSY